MKTPPATLQPKIRNILMQQAFARWYVRLPAAAGACIAAYFITMAVVVALPGPAFGEPRNAGDIVKTVSIWTLTLSLFGGQLLMNAARAGAGALTFGFAFTRFSARHTAAGAGVAVGQMAVLFGVVAAEGASVEFIPDSAAAILSVSGLIFAAALMEEILFRGLLFEPFSGRFGEAKTAVVISLLFAAAHIPNPNSSIAGIANVALAGLLLSAMRIATRTLWMPVGFHVAWNWLNGVGLGLPVSGADFGAHILRTVPAGESLMTGGAFGVEEGLLTTVLLIGAIPVVLLFTSSDPFVAAAEFRRRYAEDRLLHPERGVA